MPSSSSQPFGPLPQPVSANPIDSVKAAAIISLRKCGNTPYAEIGAALKVSEETAREVVESAEAAFERENGEREPSLRELIATLEP